jgi:prolyl-tRNA synthetase
MRELDLVPCQPRPYKTTTIRGDGEPAIADLLPSVLDDFQSYLLARAVEFRDSHTVSVSSWTAFVEAVSTGWASALHCGQPSCEDDIKAHTAATPRCIPLSGEPASGSCIRCGAVSAYDKTVLFARAY